MPDPGDDGPARQIFTSLRDNMSQPGDWFDLTEMQSQAAQEGAQQPGAPTGKPTAREAVKRNLQARSKPKPEPEPTPTKAQPTPTSDALVDVVNFCRAAATQDDIERAAQIATTIADPDEARLAQEHIDAARRRVAS